MLLRSDLQYQFETSSYTFNRRLKSLNTVTVLNALKLYKINTLVVTTPDSVYHIQKGFIRKQDSIKLLCVNDVDVYVDFEFFNTQKSLLSKYITNQVERLIICRNLNEYFEIVIKSTAKSVKAREEEKKHILEEINVGF